MQVKLRKASTILFCLFSYFLFLQNYYYCKEEKTEVIQEVNKDIKTQDTPPKTQELVKTKESGKTKIVPKKGTVAAPLVLSTVGLGAGAAGLARRYITPSEETLPPAVIENPVLQSENKALSHEAVLCKDNDIFLAHEGDRTSNFGEGNEYEEEYDEEEEDEPDTQMDTTIVMTSEFNVNDSI